MRRQFAVLVGLVSLALAGNASAGYIEQGTGGAAFQIEYFEPIGQSFTAEDEFVSIGFWFYEMNRTFPVGDITVSLLSGEGIDGELMGSVTRSVDPGFYVFGDFDFSSISLTAGNRYTALLSVANDSPYWGFLLHTGYIGDLYQGGRLIMGGAPYDFISPENLAQSDARFSVTPRIPVPEPASLALLGAALLGFGVMRRRRTLTCAA